MGHTWRHRKGAIGSDKRDDEYVRPFSMSTGMVGKVSTCASCHGVRVKWITRSGEVMNRYYPPEGYSLKGADYKPTQKEWRSAYIEAIFEEFAQEG